MHTKNKFSISHGSTVEKLLMCDCGQMVCGRNCPTTWYHESCSPKLEALRLAWRTFAVSVKIKMNPSSMFVWACVWVGAHAREFVYTIRMNACVHVCMHVSYADVYAYTCIHTCTHTYMHTYIRAYRGAYTHTHSLSHAHTHTYTRQCTTFCQCLQRSSEAICL